MATNTQTLEDTTERIAREMAGRIFVVDFANQDGAGDPRVRIASALRLDYRSNDGNRKHAIAKSQPPTIHYYDGVERRGQATNGINLKDIPELSHYLDRGLSTLALSPLTDAELGRFDSILNHPYVSGLRDKHPATWLARLKAKAKQEDRRQAADYVDGVVRKITDAAKAKPYSPLLLVVTYHLLDDGETREKAFKILKDLRSFYNIVPVLVGPDTDAEEHYAKKMLADKKLDAPYLRNCEGNDLGNILTAKLAGKYAELRISRLKDAAHKVRDVASRMPYVQGELPFTQPEIGDTAARLARGNGVPHLSLVPVGAGVEGTSTVAGAPSGIIFTPDLFGLAAMRADTLPK